ncbi:hypothetical protein BWK69_00945 [Candidatus Parcubacteria bacterium A4]|nr:MAG: hypothetical protein BWK69_00945 [Candidatus Parcubacteria bacterium A4]
MEKFKISIGKREEFEKTLDIKNYPKLESGGAPLDVRLGYGIYIELNDNVVLDNVKNVWGYAYSFALHSFDIIQCLLIKEKEYEYAFPDVGFRLKFKPINKKEVLTSFDWVEDTNYLPKIEDKREQLKDVSVPFDECIDELYNAANEYIGTLLDINSRLAESDKLKQLIEARDKAKKAIKKHKQK